MKNFFNTIYDIFASIGKARAAAHFARQGDHAAAKALMLGEQSVHIH
jgi:hypothetical protein